MHAASARHRIALTLAALCAELGILAWEHLDGGVPAHHLLANPELPSVSNWWGLVLVPALAWWTVGQAQGRADLARRAGTALRFPPAAGFLCALAYGATLAALFTGGSASVDVMFFGLLGLGLVVRLWHGEYLLGFVFGMHLAAGPVLPAIFGAVIALFSWLAQTAGRALWRRLRASGRPA